MDPAAREVADDALNVAPDLGSRRGMTAAESYLRQLAAGRDRVEASVGGDQ